MAHRLQMKLGVVAESDRLPSSADTVVVVEPSIGSISRSKGQLYVLVTTPLVGHRAQEATRLAAETIQNEYYYDESAGIRVCLEKAISAASKRLSHVRDRYALGSNPAAGPIGVGVAVVRGNELYVATVGPAEAYLIRGARLSTLPDPHRERGLPSQDLEPDVWRGEISVGDSLVLISPNMVTSLGPDELKDAMLTLHPQSAMEHLHHRFVVAGGQGSDGAIAFEASEVAVTHKGRTLVPVRPAEPLAGAADRGPIPLADSVGDGVAAVQAGARQARAAAGSALQRTIQRVQDLLPQRSAAYRRVTPMSSRVEAQRRAAVAILAFIIVAGGLGLGIYAFGGQRPAGGAIASVTSGQKALEDARGTLAKVFGPGIDLVDADPKKALELLTVAGDSLAVAEDAGVPLTTTRPLRAQFATGIDRLSGMLDVRDTIVFTFEGGEAPFDLLQVIRGPDRDPVPYVLDRGTQSVYRINLADGKATLVLRAGQEAAGATADEPRLLTVGGPDLLILDAKNVLWRWRPADATGKGTLARIPVNGSTGWGDDVRGIGTYIRDVEAGLYNLYVVEPSEQQILAFSPAADGSGFPGIPSGRLATARAVDTMASLYIDGDIFVVENGLIERFVSGRSDGWEVTLPADTLLREAPVFTLIASGSERRSGRLYGFDPSNRRLLAFDKADGRFREQFRLAGDVRDWNDLRSFYVVAGVDDAPDKLVWVSVDGIHEVELEAALGGPAASGSPDPSGAAPPSPNESAPPAP